MTNPKRRTWPAVVAGALGMGVAVTAWASEPNNDLLSQVNELKSKIAALEGQQAVKAAEVNATVDAVLRDADSHSKMLAAGAGGAAGRGAIGANLPDYGFSIVQGDFSLNIAPAVQFRGVLNYAKERKRGTDGDTQTGFEVNKARLMLQGSAWDIQYYVAWDAGDLTGGVSLLDAVIKYPLGSDQVAFIAGQMKTPISMEASTSDFELVGSTRSLVNALIGVQDGSAGRIQGAGITYGGAKDMIHAIVLFTDGLGSANTNFTDAGGVNWGLAARIDVKIMGGNWKNACDQTAKGTTDTLLVVGGGLDVTQGDNVTNWKFVVDGQFEASNFGLYAGFLGNYAKPRNTADDKSVFDWGFVAQASYLISNQLEIFGRYDFTHFKFEQPAPVSRKSFHEIAAGVNYYLGKDGSAGNNAKVTLDVAWLPKGSPVAVAYDDILGGTRKTELIVRGQLQFRP